MTHPAVEAVARAIYAMSFRNEDFDKDYLETLIDEHWHVDIPYAKAAIRALLDVPVSEKMLKAAAHQYTSADIYHTMLTQLVKEIEGTQT